MATGFQQDMMRQEECEDCKTAKRDLCIITDFAVLYDYFIRVNQI